MCTSSDQLMGIPTSPVAATEFPLEWEYTILSRGNGKWNNIGKGWECYM